MSRDFFRSRVVDRPPDEKRQATEIIGLHGIRYLEDLKRSVFQRGPEVKGKMVVELDEELKGPLWFVLDRLLHQYFDEQGIKFFSEKAVDDDAVLTVDDLAGVVDTARTKVVCPPLQSEGGVNQNHTAAVIYESKVSKMRQILMGAVENLVSVIANKIAVDSFLKERRRVFVLARQQDNDTPNLDQQLVEQIRAEWGKIASQIFSQVIFTEERERGTRTSIKMSSGIKSKGQEGDVIRIAYSKIDPSSFPTFYPCMGERELENLLELFISKMQTELASLQK
jgi:hypothetical protein